MSGLLILKPKSANRRMSNPERKTHYWHFQFEEEALKRYYTLRPGYKRGVLNCLRQVLRTEHPYAGDPTCVETLQGEVYQGIFKYRVGPYRVLFEIVEEPVTVQKHDYKGTIRIIDIDHRKDIYRP